MKNDPYAGRCPRCGLVLGALTVEAIMKKIEQHALLAHGEKIEWGPNQAGAPV